MLNYGAGCGVVHKIFVLATWCKAAKNLAESDGDPLN